MKAIRRRGLRIPFSAIILCSSFVLFLAACQKEISHDVAAPEYNLNLQFKAIVDTAQLQFGTTYKNIFLEPYTVRAFKFYVSEIDLINDDSVQIFAVDRSQYFLVDFSKPESTVIPLKTKASTYNRIGFVIGVDSLHNVSGAQDGALDPANGMFWTWNSGYIMAKLEGYSPLSNQPNNIFEYHIGGFKGAENVVQKIYLQVPSGQKINTQSGKVSTVSITANVNKWFSGTYDMSIAAAPVCMTPGPLSKQFAANYGHMFSVEQIINQ